MKNKIRQTKFYKENKNLVDERYKIFKSKVNMTYKEMIAWKKEPCSRASSIKIDEVINRVIRLLKKPKQIWTQKDFKDSAKVISYISRATRIKDSKKPAAQKIGCIEGKNLRRWFLVNYKKYEPLDDNKEFLYNDYIIYFDLERLPPRHKQLLNHLIEMWNKKMSKPLQWVQEYGWDPKNILYFRRDYENYLRSDIFGQDFPSGSF